MKKKILWPRVPFEIPFFFVQRYLQTRLASRDQFSYTIPPNIGTWSLFYSPTTRHDIVSASTRRSLVEFLVALRVHIRSEKTIVPSSLLLALRLILNTLSLLWKRLQKNKTCLRSPKHQGILLVAVIFFPVVASLRLRWVYQETGSACSALV